MQERHLSSDLSPVNSFVKKSVLLLVAIIVALLIGELIVRLMLGPHPVDAGELYRKPARDVPIGCQGNEGDSSMFISGHDCVYQGKGVHIDAFGVRQSRGRPQAPVPDGKRVAFFGDSFTFGEGVGDDETLPALVDSILQIERPSEYATINFGVPNFNSIQEYIYLRRFGIRAAPSIVIVQWLENDVVSNGYTTPDLDSLDAGRNLHLRGTESSEETGFLPRLHRWLQKESDLYAFAVPAVKEFADRYLGWHLGVEDGLWTDFSKPGALLSLESLRRASQFCAEQKISFGVVIYPVPRSLTTDYYQNNVYSKMEDFCRRNRISCLNLFTEVFHDRDFRELIVSRRNLHPNAAANRLAAKAIARWLPKVH
ncbi:MAG TPA: SGNH/GDSL hydrolase family protein [Bacteroidota bacterium]|nr:SGNH/GDSL hydrolase family protein [Bacteroidota bacterium]